ncbi:RNA polymerase [Bacillus sp. HMSC76G11]|uniref:Sigma-70 family RNA polymerase sigma factor n=1 Tax=Metabacillus idriensis TaxID=324768 RepID=A0A6I2M6Z0_9BACI|nr:sigma-70 family RNA polymerase sigma factor [Metabacillus idriensis]MRX53094.1 sigma-70 family RNA polymerase sigma factor [Metabacillus idriensis]OHR67192.1 RNA polymerase [Bacillus sp. HMSC76G11]
MSQLHIVEKAIKGNEEAFEELVKAESAKLYKTAFLYVRNKEDALDVLQDTVCKAFISIESLRQPEYFRTWLTKILIRTAYELLKKKKKTVLMESAFLEKKAAVYQESELDLTFAISALNQNYQTVIILFYYHDLSIRSIAETMNKPEGTIKTYLRRAKAELKQVLEGGELYGQKMV